MQIEFKLKRILPVLLGLVFLWGIFLFSRFILAEKPHPNHNYIPANSSLVLRLDGKHFIESAFYDLFYASGDEEIFSQLKTLSKQNRQRNIQDLGINFFSDVIVFSQPLQDKPVWGMIFNLADKDQFQKNMSSIIDQHQAFAYNDEIGILLIDLSRSFSGNELKMQAEKCLHSKGKSAFTEKWLAQNGNLLNVEMNGSPENGIGKGSLEARLNGSQVDFSGNFKDHFKRTVSSHTLKPDGFHLSIGVLNQTIQDSLKNVLASQGFHFPDIARVSVNYRGVNLEKGAMPMTDLLLEFESGIDLKEIYENPESWKKLGFEDPAITRNESTLTNGNAVYTLRMVNENTLFIGQNPDNLLNTGNNHLFLLKGDLTRLTNIEGAGLLGMGINLYPPYKASRQFFEAISVTDIQLTSQNEKLVLNGKIQFKNDKYPISESLRFLLGLGL